MPSTPAVNPWALALFRTVKTVQPATASEQSAYDKWFDLTSTREEARRDRVHASEGVIPVPLWRVLFFIAAIIVIYMLFFADSGERAVTQGLLMASVVAVMVEVATFTQWVEAYARNETCWPTSTASGSARSSSRRWRPGSPAGRSGTRRHR